MRHTAATAATALMTLIATPALCAQHVAARDSSATPSARHTETPASIAAMHRLDFLLGEWEGDGWIVLGRGERRAFHQAETVRPAAGGAVVIVDGLGKSTDPGREGAVIHQAFAIVSYDSATKAYRWRAFRATGEETLAVPQIGDSTLVWAMGVGPDGRAGRIRFTITLTSAGTWHEVGDFVQPGAPADAAGTRFFEMTLGRRGGA